MNILIGESEYIVALDLSQSLVSLGHEVCSIATTAEEALEKAEECSPDLVFLDVSLNGKKGGLKGPEVANRVKSRSAAPVIFLVSYDHQGENNGDGLKAGIYLKKPFHRNELKAILNQLATFVPKSAPSLGGRERGPVNILERIHEGVLILQDGIIQYVNSTFLKIFGYPKEELVLNSLFTFVRQSDRPRLSKFIDDCIHKSLFSGYLEFRGVTRSGRTIWLEASGTSANWGGREATLHFMRDITVRKEVEIDQADTIEVLKTKKNDLERLSFIDPLTGVGNRRYFDRMINAEWKRAGRETWPLGILILDVDYLKTINDNFGHQAGDECLRLVGRILKENLHRPGDFIARYGGDEFVILMPNTDTKGALQVAQSIQRSIINSNIELDREAPKKTITASIGVAVSIPTEIESPADLLNAADQALYDAKAKGRNRVVLYQRAVSSKPE